MARESTAESERLRSVERGGTSMNGNGHGGGERNQLDISSSLRDGAVGNVLSGTHRCAGSNGTVAAAAANTAAGRGEWPSSRSRRRCCRPAISHTQPDVRAAAAATARRRDCIGARAPSLVGAGDGARDGAVARRDHRTAAATGAEKGRGNRSMTPPSAATPPRLSRPSQQPPPPRAERASTPPDDFNEDDGGLGVGELNFATESEHPHARQPLPRQMPLRTARVPRLPPAPLLLRS